MESKPYSSGFDLSKYLRTLPQFFGHLLRDNARFPECLSQNNLCTPAMLTHIQQIVQVINVIVIVRVNSILIGLSLYSLNWNDIWFRQFISDYF